LEGLPPNWSVATVADRVGLRYAVDDLRDAVLVVGPLRSRRTTIGPRTLTVAIQGNWPAEDDRLIDSVERIAGALHGLARDAWPAGDYLYTAGRSPRSLDGAGAGGQVVDRSALVYVGGGAPGASVIDRWLHTTAHELMHWYIPQAFRFDGPPPAWFAEGFTDYFALKALLAGDLIDGARFLKEIGARLDRYRGSPLYGRESVTDAQEDFWEDDSYRYIYDGGAAAALLLDLGFQARGRSLERAVLAGRGAAPLDVARLIELFTDVPQNDWVRDWLADGVDPDWDGQLARYGLDWEDGRLVSEDDWAIERLASIRP
jgi:predicted metalloprotease with PDZ domain